MNTPENTQNDTQEIDLGQVGKGISNAFNSLIVSFFTLIFFIKRKIILIGILFIIGATLGYLADKTIKVYTHKVIVIPNFGSVDYLYSKVELLNTKIKEGDTVFLKDIGIKNTKKFSKISIEPIIDPYKFVDNKKENFELLKLMAEDGSIDKIITNKNTSKNYPYHEITFTTLNETSDDKVIDPVLAFLNDSDYFKQLQKVVAASNELRIKTNEEIIGQIDGFLNEFNQSMSGPSPKSDKLIYYNENSQLNDVIQTKEATVKELGVLRVSVVNQQKVVNDISTTLNIKNTESVNGKLKFVLPILFVFLYLLIQGFIVSYRNQIKRIQSA
jgi:hypothetical protein